MIKKYVNYNQRRGRPSYEYYIATIKGLTEFINDKDGSETYLMRRAEIILLILNLPT